MSLEYPIDVYGLRRQVFNFTVAKTYLTLNQLSQFKTYDEGYQRQKDEKHEKKIIEFLKSGNYRYLPDIILSIRHKNIKFNAKTYLISDNDFYIKAIQNYYMLRIHFWNHSGLDCVKVLDGNHRIAAIKEILKEKPNSELASIETGVTFIIANDGQTDFENEMALFYYINAKAKPLLPIDYLSEALENSLTLETAKNIDWWLFVFKKTFESLKDIFSKKLNDVAAKVYISDACDYFAKKIPEGDNEILPNTLGVIRDIVEGGKIDKAIDYFIGKKDVGILLSIIFFIHTQTNDIDKTIRNLENFFLWLTKEAKLSSFKDFEALYQTYQETYIPKDYRIFIAMAFKDGDSCFSAINGTIDKVGRDLSLPLEGIRIDKLITGTTYQIIDEIFNQIEHNRLLIADLTGLNANVYLEVGFALGLAKNRKHKPQVILLVKDEEDKTKVGFDLQGYKQLRYKETEDLRKQLEVELKAYYTIS